MSASEIFSSSGSYVLHALLITAEQLALVFGPALFFAFLTQVFSEKIMGTSAGKFGTAMYSLTMPGVALHECGHALFALIFGHKIVEFVPFRPQGDTLGYVSHTYNPKNPYQLIGNFFIGTGPVWLGSALIVGLAFLVLGSARLENLGLNAPYVQDFDSLSEVGRYATGIIHAGTGLFFELFTPETLKSPLLLLSLYLVFCIGAHMRLSPPDWQGARHGLLAIVIAFFVVNLCTAWAGDYSMRFTYWVTRYNHVLYALLTFVLLLLVFFCLLTMLICSIRFEKTADKN